MKTTGYMVLLFVGTFLLFSCASNGFLMAKPRVTLFGKTYPQKEAEATIDIYITNKPIHEYIEFASIACNDTNEKWCIKQILNKAREIGADGIIITGKAGNLGLGIPAGNYPSYIINEEYGMTAIAIKYKK